MVKEDIMEMSEYIAIREQERDATIQALLMEIDRLYYLLDKATLAYKKLKQDKPKETPAGF